VCSSDLSRLDILPAIFDWLTATPTLAMSGGGDESSWNATDESTRQPVLPTQRGPRRRQVDPAVEERAVAEEAIRVILAMADGIRWYEARPEREQIAYSLKPVGAAITLRRLAPWAGKPVVLSTHAILAIADRIRETRAVAPVGQHFGTNAGTRADVAVAMGG
jgi:hypothetical protein